MKPLLVAPLCLLCVTFMAQAEPHPHQITGLFVPERAQDLREAVAKIPQVKLVGIDFPKAEVSFEYDAKKVFPNAKAEQIVQQLDSLLKGASNHTFGVKALSSMSPDKLKQIVIPIYGHDCLACALAAYEAVARLDGVERATASFRTSQLTAWIDPAKTDRAKLEDALKKRGVVLRMP